MRRLFNRNRRFDSLGATFTQSATMGSVKNRFADDVSHLSRARGAITGRSTRVENTSVAGKEGRPERLLKHFDRRRPARINFKENEVGAVPQEIDAKDSSK